MEKVIKFLKENHVMTLATSLNDKPRASVLEYVMIGDAVIFATAEDSIKANNIKGNKKISVSVHNMPKFVTLDGAAVTPSEAEISEYNKILFERHPEFKEMVEKGIMHPFAYFKVSVETAYYNDYSTGMNPTEVIKA